MLLYSQNQPQQNWTPIIGTAEHYPFACKKRIFTRPHLTNFSLFPGLSYEFSEDLYYDFPDNSVEAEGNGNGNGNGNALPPTFLSVPLDLTLNEGSRLRLPCRVDRLQGFVLLWKKGAQIIAIGSLVIAEVNTFIVSTENKIPRWQA
jgi:hypothetical protein